jgi:hypothetical protein
VQLFRLVSPAFVVLLGGMLALTACNSSGSVSGSQPKTSNSTNAETTSKVKAPSSQGLIDAISKSK